MRVYFIFFQFSTIVVFRKYRKLRRGELHSGNETLPKQGSKISIRKAMTPLIPFYEGEYKILGTGRRAFQFQSSTKEKFD